MDDDDHEPLQEVLSAFLVPESFTVDVISHLSISTCINDMKMMMMMIMMMVMVMVMMIVMMMMMMMM